jgi:hypothetical protein
MNAPEPQAQADLPATPAAFWVERGVYLATGPEPEPEAEPEAGL